MKIARFEDIQGWQLARRLAGAIYTASRHGSLSRDSGLRDQINRASGSIMDNIAEGSDGGSNPEFIRFLQYAQRSCTEVMSRLYRALDPNHITREEFQTLFRSAAETHSCIGGLIKYLKQYSQKTSSLAAN